MAMDIFFRGKNRILSKYRGRMWMAALVAGLLLTAGPLTGRAESAVPAVAENVAVESAAAETPAAETAAAAPEAAPAETGASASAQTSAAPESAAAQTAAAQTAEVSAAPESASAQTAAVPESAQAQTTAATESTPAQTPAAGDGSAPAAGVEADLESAAEEQTVIPEAETEPETAPAVPFTVAPGGIRAGCVVDGGTGWLLPPAADLWSGTGMARRIAHTGNAGKAAQNSLLAFQKAGAAGYWGIETDVRWTADRVLICFHDESLDAHTTGTGLVEEQSWEYLSSLLVSAGNTEETGPQPIVRFGDYLDVCREYGCQALIDIKYCSLGYKGMLDAIYDAVVEHGMLEQAIFQCSLDEYLTYLREKNPQIRLWLLCGEKTATSEERMKYAAQELACEAVNVPVITEEAVILAHRYGLKCVFYLSDKPSVQDRCFDLGYDLVMEDGWD